MLGRQRSSGFAWVVLVGALLLLYLAPAVPISDPGKGGLMVLGFGMLAGAVYGLVKDLAWFGLVWWARHQSSGREVVMEELRLQGMRELASMTPEQLRMVDVRARALIQRVEGIEGPVWVYDMGDGVPVPREFVKLYLARIENGFLPPVRAWSEGEMWSRGVATRVLAEQVQRYLVRKNLAGMAAQNGRSQVWRVEDVYRHLGLEEDGYTDDTETADLRSENGI